MSAFVCGLDVHKESTYATILGPDGEVVAQRTMPRLLDMKVSKNAMTSDKFRELAERISKYVDLRGCRTKKCINDRIKRKKSKKLNILVEHDFAFRLILESWTSPHPIYKEILGMDDEVYDMFVEEKIESEKEMKKLRRWLSV